MKTFEELGVSGEIRKAIEEMGFVQPMPVQEEVIPYLLGNKNDVIALAQTGTVFPCCNALQRNLARNWAR